MCHTPCFRSEAGSYGRDTRGMIRQHQFEKVEIVQIVEPEHSLGRHSTSSRRMQKRFSSASSCRTARWCLCAGDMGFAAAKTIDLEVWLPGQKQLSRDLVVQQLSRLSRRGGCRRDIAIQRRANRSYVHTLNGSGLAVGRTLVAVMENYQDGDGRIHVPDALRGYMGGATTLDLRD